MSSTNNTLNTSSIDLLKSLIGSKLELIYHEEFNFVTVSYGYVYFKINGETYSLSDLYEVKNILGYDEEISVLKFNKFTDELKSQIINGKLVEQAVNSTINKITIVNSITSICENGITHTLSDTHAIILTLDDNYEYSFEKDDFGENISICRGYDLAQKLSRIENELYESFDSKLNPKVEINYIVL